LIGFCLVGLCSGLLAVKYFFSFLSPVICLIFATNIYHLISISAFFLLGFWLSKYIIFSSLFICAAGIVNHVGKERIYLKNVCYKGHSWNNLELRSKRNLINFKDIKAGNRIFFSAVVKNNKGVITKIFRNNNYAPNFFQRIRNKISTFLDHKIFNEIWRAIIFGDKSFLTSEIWSRFKDSGISHLLSISGLHIYSFS